MLTKPLPDAIVPCVLTIRDKGEGWAVYGEWYGQERKVWTPEPCHPLTQINDCKDWIRTQEADEAARDWNDSIQHDLDEAVASC